MYGITFNGKHSYNDLGLVALEDRNIETPSKVKIKEAIPFMSGSYDFSNLYGGNVYEERKLEYTFLVKAGSRSHLEFARMSIENWLMASNGKIKLVDDNIPNYYYMAECESVDFDDLLKNGKLKATFIAYPFKISEAYEGNNLWDSFNFEVDVLQDSNFNVNGLLNVSIINPSATNIVPYVIASNNFEIVKDNITYNLSAGTNKDYRFELKQGENKMLIRGNGSIEFRFRKEVL